MGHRERNQPRDVASAAASVRTTHDSRPTTHDSVARDERLISSALKIRYNPLVAAAGDGAWVIDADGKRYLDFGASWSLAHLGYSNADVRAAIMAQLERTMFAGLVSGINLPALDLAEKLVSLVPGEYPKKVWYGLSGSDASEAAQRLLLMATGRRRFVTFVGSWHGTTEATMALSGHPGFTGSLGGGNVTKIPYPNPYRNPFGGSSERVTDQCLDFLENYLFDTICPPGDVAAIFAESVQSDGGDVVPPPDFLPKLRALCDRHGILLVIDDIKIGLGRTGKMLSIEHAGIAADLVLLGKSLGGGLPLSAIVGRADVLDAGTGVALFTTVGNATSCAAGLATIEVIEREGLVARAAEYGDYLQRCLVQALDRYEIVGDIRGLGMIWGVELVEDRAGKRPNQPAAAKIVYRAWELGLIVYYAGNWSNVLEITPPLVLTKAEIERGVAILAEATADVAAGRVSDEAIAAFAGW
ncbi:MAG: aspartate aminotransferase family protein [Chloroflexia bacterium]|nr:aspartate aminotransferase family protein [Chloroflexia bacterium]